MAEAQAPPFWRPPKSREASAGANAEIKFAKEKHDAHTLHTCFCGGDRVLSILVAGAKDVEEDITLDKVPKAVLDAAKARFKGADLLGAAQETTKEKGY